MPYDLTWSSDPLVWILLLGPALFALHHALLGPDRFGDGVRAVAASKLWGAGLFGLVPAVVLGALGLDPIAVGLRPPEFIPFVIVTGVLGLLVLPLVALGARRGGASPQMRRSRMGPEVIVASAGVWALYLLGYEFLFRGVLLVPLAEAWGAWPALAVSGGLYGLAHLHKGRAELIGSLPMGIVFGVMALYTGGIWAPWLLYLAIVLVHENVSARADPGIRWWSTD
jgi:membrane protease YdiL (CAAX protease family)